MTTEFEKWMDEFLNDIGYKLGLTREQIFAELDSSYKNQDANFSKPTTKPIDPRRDK